MARTIEVKWDDRQLREFLNNPDGPVGEQVFAKLGEVVLAGARRRALRRTGRMAAEMYYKVGRDAVGLHTDVVSPVRSAQGFPYPWVHEKRGKVRDRRPHRSLMPALRDIRKILPS
ncbi:MAG TPA: hypothetical protein VIV12_11770 [Streptosporangiaceae bacterium]